MSTANVNTSRTPHHFDDVLERITVEEAYVESTTPPWAADTWYAIIDEERGIIAYFVDIADAYRFRLTEVNRILNP